MGTSARFCWYRKAASIVTKASNCPAARSSSSPFVLPAQPCSGTVVTSCSRGNAFLQTSWETLVQQDAHRVLADYKIGREFQDTDSLFPADCGEVLQKVLDSLAILQVLEQ